MFILISCWDFATISQFYCSTMFKADVRGYLHKPFQQAKHKAVLRFAGVNAVLFSAISPLGAGFICRVNIHLRLTPETHKLLSEHVFVLQHQCNKCTLSTALY